MCGAHDFIVLWQLQAQLAAKEGRYYICACTGEFCSEDASTPDVVVDAVSAPNERPVRYSSGAAAKIRAAEDGLTLATKQQDVPKLEAALEAAREIGASLPMIDEATAGLERIKAQLALQAETEALQAARPLQERAALKPLLAPIKAAKETGVPAAAIAQAEALYKTAACELDLYEATNAIVPLRMTDPEEWEEGACTEPPAADSALGKQAEGAIAKLANAIAAAQLAEAILEVVDAGEFALSVLTAEAELRSSLLLPKEGQAEDGTPTFTQHNGSVVYSLLEDLVFRNDFLDSSIEKCLAPGVNAAPGILNHAYKIQKDLKAALKQAQIEDDERKAKEAAAAAKAAKKKKGK